MSDEPRGEITEVTPVEESNPIRDHYDVFSIVEPMARKRAMEIAEQISGMPPRLGNGVFDELFVPVSVRFGVATVTVRWGREKRWGGCPADYDGYGHSQTFPASLLWSDDWREEYREWKEDQERLRNLERKIERLEKDVAHYERSIESNQRKVDEATANIDTSREGLAEADAKLAQARSELAAMVGE